MANRGRFERDTMRKALLGLKRIGLYVPCVGREHISLFGGELAPLEHPPPRSPATSKDDHNNRE